jgi:hypothetical protein
VGSELEPGVMRAQKGDIQISRYLPIDQKFYFYCKKYTLRSFYMELEVFFAIIQQT